MLDDFESIAFLDFLAEDDDDEDEEDDDDDDDEEYRDLNPDYKEYPENFSFHEELLAEIYG